MKITFEENWFDDGIDGYCLEFGSWPDKQTYIDSDEYTELACHLIADNAEMIAGRLLESGYISSDMGDIELGKLISDMFAPKKEEKEAIEQSIMDFSRQLAAAPIDTICAASPEVKKQMATIAEVFQSILKDE